MERLRKDGFVPVKEIKSSVYALLEKRIVVYIGKSVNYLNRVRTHRTDGVYEFEDVWVRFCEPEEMESLEEKMIKKYTPKYNKMYVSITPDSKIEPKKQRGAKEYGNSKLRKEEVLEIKKLLKLGWTKKAIGRKFNITDSNVYAIATGRSWAWLVDETSPLPKGGLRNGAKLTVEFVKQIRHLSEVGVTAGDLAKQYSVSRGCINNVVLYRTWVNI